mgnify:CR=1 FL=1
MNIQIFGTKKCNDTKKAQRFFKERGIKFQFIDMNEKKEKLLENQHIIKTPIVRNGKQATLGYTPEVWKGWS